VKDQAYVYLLSNRKHGVLYVGVTSDLVKRVWQHREGLAAGFTRRYNVKTLVWFETHGEMLTAIAREKQIKKWNRAWRIEWIERENRGWRDLYPDIL
jgi:putative endonuclease